MSTRPTAHTGFRSHSPGVRAPAPSGRGDLALLGMFIEPGLLGSAMALAERWGVAPHEALLSTGWIDERAYAAALGAALGVAVADYDFEVLDPWLLPADAAALSFGLPARWRGVTLRIFDAGALPPSMLAERIAIARERGQAIAIAPRRCVDAALAVATAASGLDAAVNGLRRQSPELSAGSRYPRWQPLVLILVCGGFIGAAIVLPSLAVALLLGLMAVPFVGIVMLRLAAAREIFRRKARPVAAPVPDRELPTYSILVPLYDEADVLPGLVDALARLDYPAAKLEILLILEEVDMVTKVAILDLALPAIFHTCVVPEAQPRTKPKALNYALRFARGEYVVVYDAEDRPEADQLRRAVAAFRSGPADLACVQARLNLYNPCQSWYTKQFTVEYSALFDAILPALETLRLPVPLGGTSNHFPRAMLTAVGAWDPFNVTEDADLGIRLARHGWRTQVLASTTWEEAPAAAGEWLRQRTRWLKGWMQTFLVHTRRPLALARDIGPAATVGFHVFMGGLVLSALIHPWFYLLLVWNWAVPEQMAVPDPVGGDWVLRVSWANLVLGYASAILVGAIAARRRRRGLTLTALLMPFYWLQISAAAYRALWQLYRDPFRWEKTAHGRAEVEPAPAPKQRRKSGRMR